MRIKKFVGSTAKEAADKMRQEFGEDAVILNTRRVSKGGVLDAGGEEYVEVTAAYDEAPIKVQPRRVLKSQPANKPAGEDVLGSLRQLASKFEEKRRTEPGPKLIAPTVAQAVSTAENDALKQELSEVKSALGEIAQHIKHTKMPVLSESLKNVYMSLLESEVEEEIALEIVQACNHKLSGPEIDNQFAVDGYMFNSIARRFLEAPVRRLGRKGYVIALVGPTGVGKTTTVAKLASIGKLVRGENVAMITADTYRIGAIDQLKAFADIASIPLSVVYTPDEMIAAIRKYSNYDTIYIDTVGRSQRSADKIMELGRFIDAADPNEVHLVLTANFSLNTVRDIYKKFKSLKPNRLLITKTDEAVSLGMLLSLAQDSRLPFSFVTNGQSVPDDIEPASGDKLAKMIYKVGAEANA
jgi:flagellar biosynthesis protein FlhF